MPAEVRVPVSSDADVVTARAQGRTLAAQLPFSATELTLIATAISEVARNIVLYAPRGEVVLRLTREEGREGIVVTARDEGPGIEDVALALQDHFSTGQGSGLGLPGARRLMDEFELESGPSGTTVTMRKWASRRA
ncbi:MAG: anti-sigma regulatory factor [Actinobacteria bacterium]|nr:MAG: anti-sigma regulatory factor [Actinomycetota bacterium]